PVRSTSARRGRRGPRPSAPAGSRRARSPRSARGGTCRSCCPAGGRSSSPRSRGTVGSARRRSYPKGARRRKRECRALPPRVVGHRPPARANEAPVSTERGPRRRAIGHAFAAAIAFGIAALWVTRPLAAHLLDHSLVAYPYTAFDIPLNAWILSWVSHALATRPWALFDANIYWPQPHALAYT